MATSATGSSSAPPSAEAGEGWLITGCRHPVAEEFIKILKDEKQKYFCTVGVIGAPSDEPVAEVKDDFNDLDMSSQSLGGRACVQTILPQLAKDYPASNIRYCVQFIQDPLLVEEVNCQPQGTDATSSSLGKAFVEAFHEANKKNPAWNTTSEHPIRYMYVVHEQALGSDNSHKPTRIDTLFRGATQLLHKPSFTIQRHLPFPQDKGFEYRHKFASNVFARMYKAKF